MYRNDGTITTTNSSVYSSIFSKQHPHDTFPMHASDFVVSKYSQSGYHDPHRIDQIMILEGDTEIGEI